MYLPPNPRVLVHAYGNELMKDLLRVTIGSEESMAFFINALLDVDK